MGSSCSKREGHLPRHAALTASFNGISDSGSNSFDCETCRFITV